MRKDPDDMHSDDDGERPVQTRGFFEIFGQPLPALPIAGHQCGVPGCSGYVRSGKRCADHVAKVVS